MPIAAPPPPWLISALVVVAYLIGTLSPGWILTRARAGVDLREAGSGVTGASNAARILGRGGYAWVLVLDTIKGWAAVWLALACAPANPWAALAAPAVVAGHIWPFWLGFRGGRGAATFMGICLALDWRIVALAWIPGIIIGVVIRKGFAARAIAFIFSLAFGCYLLSSVEARTCLLIAWAMVLLAHRSHFAKHIPG